MTDTIHTAINAVMKQVGYVQKKKSGDLKYSFAGEAALIDALRPAMVEAGIYMYTEDVIDVDFREYETRSGAAMVNVTMTARIRFVHAPTETSILVTARGEGSDSGDKASNKAMTGAYKYALRQTFCIETGDDPDESHEDRKEKSHRAPTERNTTGQRQSPPTTNGNGKPHQPAQYSPAAVINGQAVVQTVVGYITKEQWDEHAESLANADDQRTDAEKATALLIAQVTKAQVIDHMVEKTNLARQHVESTLTKCSLTAAATLDDFEAWWDLYRGERSTGKTSDEAATYANNTMLAQPA